MDLNLLARRNLIAALAAALSLSFGCGAMSSDGALVEHEIDLKFGQPKVRVTNVVLMYGNIEPVRIAVLTSGGRGVTGN